MRKWWHEGFKEMPAMWQYKELESKARKEEMLILQI
jgi:hypothetical protein